MSMYHSRGFRWFHGGIQEKKYLSYFLNKCWECENPEALYRQGLLDFFSYGKIKSGIDKLRRAISKGHVGALYAMGIILLFFGDEFKLEGVKILSEPKKSKLTRTKARDLRENLKDAITETWVRNGNVLQQRPSCCTRKDRRFNLWDYDNTRASDCEGCQCDLDIGFICQYFHTNRLWSECTHIHYMHLLGDKCSFF